MASTKRAGNPLGPGQIPFTNPLPSMLLAVPEDVHIDADHLLWRLPDPDWIAGEPPEGALRAFVLLADEASPEVFAEFARRFGVLGLDREGESSLWRDTKPTLRGGVGNPGWYGESVAQWRQYARNAKAVVSLAAALRSSDRPIDAARFLATRGIASEPLPLPAGPLMDRTVWWLTRELDHWGNAGTDPAAQLQAQRDWLLVYVSRYWVAAAALTPRLTWDHMAPRVTLASGAESLLRSGSLQPLMGVLAAQIIDAVCGASDTMPCEGCGNLIDRDHGRRRYCAPCAPKARQASKTASQKNSRAKRKTASSTQ